MGHHWVGSSSREVLLRLFGLSAQAYLSACIRRAGLSRRVVLLLQSAGHLIN